MRRDVDLMRRKFGRLDSSHDGGGRRPQILLEREQIEARGRERSARDACMQQKPTARQHETT